VAAAADGATMTVASGAFTLLLAYLVRHPHLLADVVDGG